jgi:hypothetical protein
LTEPTAAEAASQRWARFVLPAYVADDAIERLRIVAVALSVPFTTHRSADGGCTLLFALSEEIDQGALRLITDMICDELELKPDSIAASVGFGTDGVDGDDAIAAPLHYE